MAAQLVAVSIPIAKGEAFVGLHSSRDLQFAWPFTVRWEEAQVQACLGAIYAQPGETAEEGWERAVDRGWSVMLVTIRGHVH